MLTNLRNVTRGIAPVALLTAIFSLSVVGCDSSAGTWVGTFSMSAQTSDAAGSSLTTAEDYRVELVSADDGQYTTVIEDCNLTLAIDDEGAVGVSPVECRVSASGQMVGASVSGSGQIVDGQLTLDLVATPDAPVDGSVVWHFEGSQ